MKKEALEAFKEKLGSPLFERSFWKKVEVGPNDECWPWTASKSSTGYGQMAVYVDKKTGSYPILAHNIALALAQGQPVDGAIGHTCGRRECCNPRHLYVTEVEDVLKREAAKRKRAARKRHEAKILPQHAKAVRTLYRKGSKKNGVSALARMFGVSRRLIYRILEGEVHGHT